MKIYLFELCFYSHPLASCLSSMIHHHVVHVFNGLLYRCYFKPRNGNSMRTFSTSFFHLFSQSASVIFCRFLIFCSFVAAASSSLRCTERCTCNGRQRKKNLKKWEGNLSMRAKHVLKEKLLFESKIKNENDLKKVHAQIVI